MIQKPTHPRLTGVDTGPKIEDIPKVDLTPTPDVKYHTAVWRLLAQAGLDGITLTVEDAKKEADRMHGRTVLESLDNSIFIDPIAEAKDKTKIFNESLREAFVSKGSKLGQPAEFIEEIFEIRRLMGTIGETPDQEEKIKITDQFKRFVELTAWIHNRNRALKNNRRNDKKTPTEIEAFRTRTIAQIRKEEGQRLDIYRRLFRVSKLIKAGIMEDESDVERLLTDESLTLIRVLKNDDFPDELDNTKKNRYILRIDKYSDTLQQEE